MDRKSVVPAGLPALTPRAELNPAMARMFAPWLPGRLAFWRLPVVAIPVENSRSMFRPASTSSCPSPPTVIAAPVMPFVPLTSRRSRPALTSVMSSLCVCCATMPVLRMSRPARISMALGSVSDRLLISRPAVTDAGSGSAACNTPNALLR